METEKKFIRVSFPELGFELSSDDSGPESWNSVRHLLSDKPLFRPAPRKTEKATQPNLNAAPSASEEKPKSD